MSRLAEPLVRAAHDGQHLGLQLRLAGELALDARGAAVEDGRARWSLRPVATASGIRARQESGEKLADLRGFLRLEPRPVALRGDVAAV